MVSARALIFGSRKTYQILTTTEGDTPLGVQLLAGDENILAQAVACLRGRSFDLLELNAACPVGKVVKRGEGAALLKEPARFQRLARVLVAESQMPVTVKIRAGWDDQSVNAVEIARIAEGAGVKGIFIHGRTRQQGYKGEVSYEIIKAVKRAVSIPVIGSGNIFSARLAARMLAETGCDGVAVARGALGNPWIFVDLLDSGNGIRGDQTPDVFEVVRVMKRHLDLSVQEHGEKIGVISFRKFFCWYSKGFSNAAELRRSALTAKTSEEMGSHIDELEKERHNKRSSDG